MSPSNEFTVETGMGKASPGITFRKRVSQGLKLIVLLVVAVNLIFVALYLAGSFITSRIETVSDPHTLAPWGPGTSFLSTKSGEVHILDIGEGEVILLIHGSSGSIADWQERVAYPLSEKYRVVAFDSYGFGLSERNDSFGYGFDLWTQQAIDVLDALGIERAVVLGHSAGAITAVKLGAEHPERIRGVILSGHGLTVDPAQIIPALPGIGELWATQQTVIGDTFSDSHREQAEAVHQIRGTRAAYLSFIRSQYSIESVRDFFVSSIYEDIEAPVLQIHGGADKSQDIDSARELSSRLKDTRFVTIEESDHHTHNEAPHQWLEAVTTSAESLSP